MASNNCPIYIRFYNINYFVLNYFLKFVSDIGSECFKTYAKGF